MIARSFNRFTRYRNFTTSLFKSMPKKGKKEAGGINSQVPEAVSENDGLVSIKVHAKPGAKFNSITGVGEEVGVQIAAPPVDGEANTEIVKYLAKLFGLKKSQVSLDKGSRSRSKVILVSGMNKEVVLKTLSEAVDDS